jgi:hypothetical protein
MAILFCGLWSRAEQSDQRCLWFVALVPERVNPHFGTVVGASGNSQVETVHRRSRSEVPMAAIARGVEVLDVEQFVGELVHAK